MYGKKIKSGEERLGEDLNSSLKPLVGTADVMCDVIVWTRRTSFCLV